MTRSSRRTRTPTSRSFRPPFVTSRSTGPACSRRSWPSVWESSQTLSLRRRHIHGAFSRAHATRHLETGPALARLLTWAWLRSRHRRGDLQLHVFDQRVLKRCRCSPSASRGRGSHAVAQGDSGSDGRVALRGVRLPRCAGMPCLAVTWTATIPAPIEAFVSAHRARSGSVVIGPPSPFLFPVERNGSSYRAVSPRSWAD